MIFPKNIPAEQVFVVDSIWEETWCIQLAERLAS